MPDSSDLTPARCPRCGEAFGCGASSSTPCACTRIRLSPALQKELRERYSGCLCPQCLFALGGQSLEGPTAPAAGSTGR